MIVAVFMAAVFLFVLFIEWPLLAEFSMSIQTSEGPFAVFLLFLLLQATEYLIGCVMKVSELMTKNVIYFYGCLCFNISTVCFIFMFHLCFNVSL